MVEHNDFSLGLAECGELQLLVEGCPMGSRYTGQELRYQSQMETGVVTFMVKMH